MRRLQTRRTTDYGTVILHAVLLAAFLVLMATGLRIAADDPDVEWLIALDPVLPVEHLWFRHMVAGTVLTAALAAYVAYVRRGRLAARILLDKARLAAIVRPGRQRWSALNVVVYWVLMLALGIEIVTGVWLFAEGGRLALTLHLDATFVCLGAAALHAALHAAYGGVAQLVRIFRPAPLHVGPPPPDLAVILAEQLAKNQQSSQSAAGSVIVPPDRPGTPGQPQRQPATLQANPFATALAAAAGLGIAAVGAEQATRPVLFVAEIARSDVPVLDGDLSDPAWARSKPVTVLTTQGGDFGGAHQSLVEIRAVHDGEYAYFAFVWEDPTRSLKHFPLLKRAGRWEVVKGPAAPGHESAIHEDKFSVLLARSGLPLIGGAIHLARQPVADRPPSVTGRGLHFTDGAIADVWQWRASHAGPYGHVDNCHFGGPAPAEAAEAGEPHYSGGFALDPSAVPYQANVMESAGPDGRTIVRPRRLPRDLGSIQRLMGRPGDGAGESEAEGSRWWMTMAESVPFTPELDARIPDGALIPGVVMSDRIEDQRDSIRGTARWAAGRWTLEVVRRLHTGSHHDLPIRSGTLLWVAAFDHAHKRHTRHLRPFRLEIE